MKLIWIFLCLECAACSVYQSQARKFLESNGTSGTTFSAALENEDCVLADSDQGQQMQIEHPSQITVRFDLITQNYFVCSIRP